MNHTLRRAGEVHRTKSHGPIPVYTYDGCYEYNVHEGDTVIINDGPTSSMYILKGDNLNCGECPISTGDELCAAAVKCTVTGIFRTVCRARFGVHPIDEILEDL